MNKWQIGPVKLANGEDAFIDAINEGQEDFRYSGRIGSKRGILISAGWNDEGRYMYAASYHDYNLAPPPKKTVRVQRWMVVYPSGSTQTFTEQTAAIAEANKFGFALIPIDLEVTEREGL